jgi:16S rRNA processing protein RimM
MTTNDCFSPGFFLRPHGIKGGLVLKITMKSFPIQSLDMLLIESKGQLLPLEINEISLKNDLAYLKLSGIQTPEQANGLRNQKIYVPNSLLPVQSSKDTENEYMGYLVSDTVFGTIGSVESVGTNSVQPLLEIRTPDNKLVIIPLVEPFINEINVDKRCIILKTPDGLLDVYLNPDSES